MKQFIVHLQKEIFLKNYHQRSATLNDSDQNIEFIFAEKINYHQIRIASLQYELTVEKYVAAAANRVLVNGDDFR